MLLVELLILDRHLQQLTSTCNTETLLEMGMETLREAYIERLIYSLKSFNKMHFWNKNGIISFIWVLMTISVCST